MAECKTCDGQGSVKCPKCKGTGRVGWSYPVSVDSVALDSSSV